MDVPPFMETILESPLSDKFVSPKHPVTARKDILQAAKTSQLRQKLMAKSNNTYKEHLWFAVISLLVVCVGVVLTAKMLEADKRTGSILLMWVGLFVAWLVAYFLVFYVILSNKKLA